MKFIFLLFYATVLFSQENIHSSFSTYLDSKNFKHSKQKQDAKIYGIGVDFHTKKSGYKVVFEYGATSTKQPPLTKDLAFSKLYLKYMYKINNSFISHIHYANIVSDNIAITDGGSMYGLGMFYNIKKNLALDVTQYYTKYDDFYITQSDMQVIYKMNLQQVKMKLSSTFKYIDLHNINPNSFTKNAKDNYFTTHLMLHAHYNSYHLGLGAMFGSFAFGVMDNGFKLPHHAMEITQSYGIGVGKTIGNIVVRSQYIKQKATELPMSNKGVEISVWRVLLNYKF